MTTLVVGASGATGRLLVTQLLQRGEAVRVVVRPGSELSDDVGNAEQLSITRASLLDLEDAEINRLVGGCDAVVSCLGHNLSFKGIYGHPRQLVTDAIRRLSEAIEHTAPATPVRLVLMNSSGCRNRDLDEKISFAQNCIIWLLRMLLPPHLDNETAADYLRTRIGQSNPSIEWVAVRPDGLIDADEVSAYEEYASPIRSAIFDPGQTSRINVADFMTRLVCDDESWRRWQGKMPVIYNRD